MRTSGIHPDDIVKCNVKGRIFLATVVEKKDRRLRLRPITPNINYFEVTSNQVTDHWKKMGINGGRISS
jgi:hypothetical protein